MKKVYLLYTKTDSKTPRRQDACYTPRRRVSLLRLHHRRAPTSGLQRRVSRLRLHHRRAPTRGLQRRVSRLRLHHRQAPTSGLQRRASQLRLPLSDVPASITSSYSLTPEALELKLSPIHSISPPVSTITNYWVVSLHRYILKGRNSLYVQESNLFNMSRTSNTIQNASALTSQCIFQSKCSNDL